MVQRTPGEGKFRWVNPDLSDKAALHLLDKTHWPVENPEGHSLYTVEATAYALMQKLELGRHNETQAIAKWLLENREPGGGFRSTQVTRASGMGAGVGVGKWGALAKVLRSPAHCQELSAVLILRPHPNPQTTVVAIEALTRFRQAAPFEGVQDLHVQIHAPKRALSVKWIIDQNNAYQQRSAKVLRMKPRGMFLPVISLLRIISHHCLYCRYIHSFTVLFSEHLLCAKHSPGH